MDCELLREVYINLLDAKEPKLEFSNEVTNKISKSEIKISIEYSKKIIQLSEEDLEKHKNFLKKELKKNFY